MLTGNKHPDEQGLVLFVVLQHALEVLLLPLKCDLPDQLGPIRRCLRCCTTHARVPHYHQPQLNYINTRK